MKPIWLRFKESPPPRASRTLLFLASFLGFSFLFISWSASGDSTTLTVTVGPPATCSNGTIESGEECDGAELNGQSCSAQGFSGGGTLSCNANCTLNTSQCSAGTSVTFGGGIIWQAPKVAVPPFSSFSPHGLGTGIPFIPGRSGTVFNGFAEAGLRYTEGANEREDTPAIMRPPETSPKGSFPTDSGNVKSGSREEETGTALEADDEEQCSIPRIVFGIIATFSIFLLAYVLWRMYGGILP